MSDPSTPVLSPASAVGEYSFIAFIAGGPGGSVGNLEAFWHLGVRVPPAMTFFSHRTILEPAFLNKNIFDHKIYRCLGP